MGLFDFLKKKNKPTNEVEASAETQKEGYYGDLEKTAILDELFHVQHEQRDESWRQELFRHVADASFACGDPQIVQGPDGFHYCQLNIPEPNKSFQCYVIRHMIPDFIMERGLGIAINLYKGQPDWVFSYGDLVNFFLKDEFYSEVPNVNLQQTETIEGEEKVLIGAPSENFLPEVQRVIIRDFLTQQGVSDVKVLLMSRNYGDVVMQELVLNLTPQKIGQEKFDVIMQYLGWFLPKHYSVVAMDEEGSLKGSFMPL